MTNPKMLHSAAKLVTCQNCAFGAEQNKENPSVQLVCYYNPPTAFPAPSKDLLGSVQIATISVRPVVSRNDFCAFGIAKPQENRKLV
jgi:hypothetical protein